MTVTTIVEPRVWVACLGCYNDGELVGAWFDGTEAPQDMDAFNEAVTITYKPTQVVHLGEAHEELWVLDHEGYGGLIDGECSPSDAVFLAEQIAELGDQLDAVKVWHENYGSGRLEWDRPTRESFEDRYVGHHDSEKDFAMEEAENRGYRFDIEQPWPHNCIDWDDAADHLFNGEYASYPADGGGVHVFRNDY
jgi:antirestriction protein